VCCGIKAAAWSPDLDLVVIITGPNSHPWLSIFVVYYLLFNMSNYFSRYSYLWLAGAKRCILTAVADTDTVLCKKWPCQLFTVSSVYYEYDTTLC